jgi:hypothetical protein
MSRIQATLKIQEDSSKGTVYCPHFHKYNAKHFRQTINMAFQNSGIHDPAKSLASLTAEWVQIWLTFSLLHADAFRLLKSSRYSDLDTEC